MKHLYFIGNGFDLHHGFKTDYFNFSTWLKQFDEEAYNNINELYGVADDESKETKSWWSTFEAHLVDFDVYEDIVEIASENQINYGADDFHEGDRYDGGVAAEQKFEETMCAILGYFGTWVDSLGDLKSNKIVALDKEAEFISFNYTLTLENLYNIPKSNVHHFHGKLGDETYILGHGRTYKEINKSIRANEPKPPKGMPDEELQDWYAGQWDEVYENTVDYTASKLASYKKDTVSVIKANEDLFASMSDLEKITIYGCSFSEIDTPYFAEAISRVKDKNKLKLEANWYHEKDKVNIYLFFKEQGIPEKNITILKLDKITTITE